MGNNRTRFGLFSSPMPNALLPALEQHLETRLLELNELHRERPGLPTAMAWAEAGQRIDDLLYEIAELQWLIDERSAETLEDAAVKLRRLEAYVEEGPPARTPRLSYTSANSTEIVLRNCGSTRVPCCLMYSAMFERRQISMADEELVQHSPDLQDPLGGPYRRLEIPSFPR